MRAPEIEPSKRRKEDIMVPGFSDIDCRVAEFRLREMHGEARRRHTADFSISPPQRAGVFAGIRHQGAALLAQILSCVPHMRSVDMTTAAATPALGSSK